MIVHFEKVGRDDLSFVRECKGNLGYDWLEKQVGKYYKVNDLCFLFREQDRIGYIMSGFYRVIGFFWWEV